MFKKADSLEGLYILLNGVVSQIYSQRNIQPPVSKEPFNQEKYQIKVNSQSILLEENTTDLVGNQMILTSDCPAKYGYDFGRFCFFKRLKILSNQCGGQFKLPSFQNPSSNCGQTHQLLQN